MKTKNASALLLVFFIFISYIGHPQTANKTWSVKWSAPKSFIENKGQFSLYKSSEEVLFAYDNGSTMIYFTKNGVRYSFLKRWIEEEEGEKFEKNAKEIDRERGIDRHSSEEWEEREKQEHKMKYETDVVGFDWLNANAGVQIIGDEETSDYNSYPIKQKDNSVKNVNLIKGYHKLIYKDIYPGIDVEFKFHPVDGIKYAVILHPGANLSDYKMKYTEKVKVNNDGNVIITTKFGDIVEHAPISFYGGDQSNQLKSAFSVKNNTVSFKLDAYNNSQEAVIDPWVQTPTLQNSNGVWECEKDAAGNVYIIGGDMPMKLQKYNALGTIQWTYNTPWDTANYWLGTFATDLQGNSYVTAGSIANLKKIDNGGNEIWSYPAPVLSADEYWNIAFNCDQTKLIIGGTVGTLTSLQGAVFDINTSNGSINNIDTVGWGNMFGFPPTINEVRSITSCANSRYYFLTLDTIGCLDDNFTACSSSPTLFRINSTYNLSYRCENYRPNNGNSGIMAIRANRYFVYTQNGIQIDKRSLATGAIITTAAIPGGISISSLGQNEVGNSGIDIDSCGNVYVGSGDQIIKYDADLNLITSVNTPFRVYDVAVSSGGNIIICGATDDNSHVSRTGYVQSLNMSACDPMILYCCNANICPAGPFCPGDAPFTLVTGQTGGTFSGLGVDPGTGVFTPSTAGVGVHTITYTLPCGSGSIDIVVNSCVPLNACLELDSNITVSGGDAPYTWQQFYPATSSPITNQAECTACGLSWVLGIDECFNGLIPVTSCDVAAHWTTYATGATATPPGTFPIQAVDNYGESIVIYNYASLPPCALCPTITVTSSNIVNASCAGGNNGTFDASASGGTGPYNYTLLLGGTAVANYPNVPGLQSFTGLAGGTYTLNVTDANNCPGTTTVVIGENPFSVSASSNSPVCVGATINFTASGGTNYIWSGPNSYSSSAQNPSITLSTMSNAGTYYVTVSAPPCSDTVVLHVVVNPAPNVNAGQDTTINSGVQITLHGSGGPSYSWSPSATLNNPNIANPLATPYNTTTYTLTVTDSLGCSSIDAVIISVNPGALFVPNIFSPNGDGENDILYVYGSSIKVMKFSVFNRWGEKVFESNLRTNGWDGNYKGKPCDAGVFVYHLEVTYLDNTEAKLSGNVTLVR